MGVYSGNTDDNNNHLNYNNEYSNNMVNFAISQYNSLLQLKLPCIISYKCICPMHHRI